MSACEIDCIIDDEEYLIEYNVMEWINDFTGESKTIANVLDVWDNKGNLIDINSDYMFLRKCENVAQEAWEEYCDEYYEEN